MSFRDMYKTKLCMLFARGNCDRVNCTFAHGEDELRKPPAGYPGKYSGFRGGEIRDRLRYYRSSPPPELRRRRSSPSRKRGRSRSTERSHEDFSERSYGSRSPSPAYSSEERFRERELRRERRPDCRPQSGQEPRTDFQDAAVKAQLEDEMRVVIKDIGVKREHLQTLETLLAHKGQLAEELGMHAEILEKEIMEKEEAVNRVSSQMRKLLKAQQKLSSAQDDVKRLQSKIQKLVAEVSPDDVAQLAMPLPPRNVEDTQGAEGLSQNAGQEGPGQSAGQVTMAPASALNAIAPAPTPALGSSVAAPVLAHKPGYGGLEAPPPQVTGMKAGWKGRGDSIDITVEARLAVGAVEGMKLPDATGRWQRLSNGPSHDVSRKFDRDNEAGRSSGGTGGGRLEEQLFSAKDQPTRGKFTDTRVGEQSHELRQDGQRFSSSAASRERPSQWSSRSVSPVQAVEPDGERIMPSGLDDGEMATAVQAPRVSLKFGRDGAGRKASRVESGREPSPLVPDVERGGNRPSPKDSGDLLTAKALEAEQVLRSSREDTILRSERRPLFPLKDSARPVGLRPGQPSQLQKHQQQVQEQLKQTQEARMQQEKLRAEKRRAELKAELEDANGGKGEMDQQEAVAAEGVKGDQDSVSLVQSRQGQADGVLKSDLGGGKVVEDGKAVASSDSVKSFPDKPRQFDYKYHFKPEDRFEPPVIQEQYPPVSESVMAHQAVTLPFSASHEGAAYPIVDGQAYGQAYGQDHYVQDPAYLQGDAQHLAAYYGSEAAVQPESSGMEQDEESEPHPPGMEAEVDEPENLEKDVADAAASMDIFGSEV